MIGSQQHAKPCPLCTKPAFILDAYGICAKCGIAVDQKMAASLPALMRDCDAMGAFHQWTRQHDESKRA